MRRLPNLVLLGAAILLPGCMGGEESSDRTPDDPRRSGPSAEQVRTADPGPSYRPLGAEDYPNGKRLAARVAQAVTTYAPGATAASVARKVARSRDGRSALARSILPLVERGVQSSGEVLYPQLSGVTPTTMGTMVLVRQTKEDADGNRDSVERVIDIRLRRTDGPWRLDRVGSVGGTPPRRPAPLSMAAREILAHPRIQLSDSARWDIQGGGVDERLLDALSVAAERRRYSVGVLRSGHPPNVWATTRPSAHSAGYAADIYAVGGRPVVEQQREGSPAFQLAADLVAGGASQVGSPWILGTGAPRSFSDDVHQDHIHLQQTPLPDRPES